MSQSIDWVTSLKPTKLCRSGQGNHLVNCFPMIGFNLKYVNKLGEINLPASYGEQIQFKSGSRPTLRNILMSVSSDICVISNSDVIPIISGLSEFLNKKTDDYILFGRRIDIQSIDNLDGINDGLTKQFVRKIGFNQSPCTIDLFLMTMGAVKALLKEDWLDDYYLGAPGVDMKLAEFACKTGLGGRYDKVIRVIHPNHEDYRVNFRTNVVTDPDENLRFSHSRAASFSGTPCSINVALLPFFLQKMPVVRYLVTAFDLTVNRVRNWYQYSTSGISRALVRLFNSKNIPCKMYVVGNVMLPLPSRSGKKNISHRQMVIDRLSQIRKEFLDD